MMREVYEKGWKTFFKCSSCWEFKEATKDNFYVRSSNPFWFANVCKICDKKYHQEIYLKNREEILQKTNKYYHSHREAYLENYIKKRDKRLAYAKEYRENNIEKIKASRENNKERYANNRINDEDRQKRYKERRREYKESHRGLINEKRRKRYHEKWYAKIHTKTSRAINKLWIRPTICPICWKEWRIEAHHPDYNKWNEIIFCCNVCHQRIHNWWFICTSIIDLLKF